LALLLGGCQAVVLSPSGSIAAEQRDLLVQSTGLMLLIIVPVMALTIFFAWHYRQSNKAATYEPDWDHSTQLELVIWGAPLLIIICLGALTWMGTHLLDPYRPLNRNAANEAAAASSAPPLEVEVVALDWKWLFIYPQYGIATVNEMAAPADRPITFRITASSVMNSFYIPALAGQIYAMPGMETKLHAVMNTAGTYQGFSANYSGAGFSGMHFAFRSLDAADFDGWVNNIKNGGTALDRTRYLELEKPSENVPVLTFGRVDPALYDAILNLCVQPGKMCRNEMSAIDAKGGLGLAGINNLLPLQYDKYVRRGTIFGPMPTAVASICDKPSDGLKASGGAAEATPPASAAPLSSTPLRGAGLERSAEPATPLKLLDIFAPVPSADKRPSNS
jgi:cytochrome o ubiquinol oxidase subunit 2